MHRREKPAIELENLTSTELLREWKAGNQRAAEIIASRYAIRMVALVASKLNRKYRGATDPEDIVQSAFGSFFAAAKQSRLQLSQSVSLWQLLATFAQRKMLRSIERASAIKRGGDFDQVPIDDLLQRLVIDPTDARSSIGKSTEPSIDEAPEPSIDESTEPSIDELVGDAGDEMTAELRYLLESLLAGMTQAEIAAELCVTERTVRRRIVRLRELLTTADDSADEMSEPHFQLPKLKRVGYNEFVLGKLIGAGGFGKVYRASMQTGELVAVKFLRKAFWQDPDAKRSFLRELDQTAPIEHPAIVKYLGWGESPHGGPYAIAPWIDASPLTNHQSVEPETFLHYLQQICHAVSAVHNCGVVHGDLTPSNILVDGTEKVFITDFGFARSPGSPDHVQGGTLGFAAPEQISPSLGQVGTATDIYAIGGIAYWYLAGHPPHAANAQANAVADTISESSRSLDFISAKTSTTGAIKQVVQCCLKKPVLQRPSITEVISMLSTFGES